MNVISSEKRLCECCMERHTVQRIAELETTMFKNSEVDFVAEYFYCDRAQERYEDEEMISKNDISMKNAYRKKNDLLTTEEIQSIRKMYDITQSDLCILLGWGEKTIARYESHQVQDNAHDTILRKLAADPGWFIDLLGKAKSSFTPLSFSKYMKAGRRQFRMNHDVYVRRAIQSEYAPYEENAEYTGGKELSLDTVVDMINYFSNSVGMNNLYKVKLMKLLWYSDALSFKRRGHSISGLVYKALPMGAAPISHDSIIDLQGVHYETMEIGDGTAFKFVSSGHSAYSCLSGEDKEIMDTVIRHFGKATTDEIVCAMHKEDAFTKTEPRNIIEFKHAKTLSLR